MGSRLPKGATLPQFVRSALAFLCMTREEHMARTQTQRTAGLDVTKLPLVAFDEATQSYRWLGDEAASSDAALQPLDASHYERFTSAGAAGFGILGGVVARLGTAPSKTGKGVITLPPGSAEQLAALRQEEVIRYGQPDQPFKYTLRDGSSSAVAPIGKKASRTAEKKRTGLPVTVPETDGRPLPNGFQCPGP